MGIYIHKSSDHSFSRGDGAAGPAKSISFNSTPSGLEATNVQDAVDEINGNFIRTYPPFVRNDNLITANTFEEFIIGGIQLLKLRDLLIEEGDITKTMLGWRGRGWFEFEIDVLTSGTEFYILVLVKSLQGDVDIYTNIKDIDDTLQIISISYSCRNETYFANSTERRIGKWMNGKPLYKKIIPITIPACVEEGTEVSNFSEAVSNEAISVISFYGFYTNTYGNVETIPNGSAVRNIFHTQSKTIITYNKALHNNNCSGYCIVKYTKNNE